MSDYTFDSIKEEIIKILEDNGLVAETEDNGDAFLDISTIDSITFISFIIDVENKLEIVFPDDLLSIDVLQSLNGFVGLLYELVNEA